MNISLSFLPLIPIAWIAAAVLCVVLGVAAAFFLKWRVFTMARVMAVAVIAVVLLNPQAVSETREYGVAKVLVIVDESASQKIDGRMARTEKALAHLLDRIRTLKDTEAVVIRTDGQSATASGGKSGTFLFGTLREALSQFTAGDVAGTVLLTDGQVADAPEDAAALVKAGPVNAVLTGRADERDHRVEIVSVPKFGLIGGEAVIRLRAVSGGDGAMDVTMSQDGQETDRFTMRDGEEKDVTVTLKHAGQNAVSFRIPEVAGEISTANNHAVAVVRAIRDRLRVLLVSGAPHMGERAWRNILKSDPAIELVHFTILRSPQSMDATPSNEMALIPFPVDEIFRNKLSSFDLVILDRYRQYDLLPEYYFNGIRDYIEKGGAMFLAVGTDMADDQVFGTALGDILPVTPAGDDVLTGDIMPKISDAGKKHPVTAGLAEDWSAWHGQVPFRADARDTLMTGLRGYPLLTIREAGGGRIAVLASDNIWIWSKASASGKSRGPYMPLIGNVIDWLTREPDMDAGFLKAETMRDDTIRISLRPSTDQGRVVSMTAPDGTVTEIRLSDELAQGWHTAQVAPEQPGLYSFGINGKVAYAVSGGEAQAEYAELLSGPEKLRDVVDATGGGIIRAGDHPDFGVGYHAGGNQVTLASKKPYSVLSTTSNRLLPEWLGLLLVVGAMMGCWWSEGRRRA